MLQNLARYRYAQPSEIFSSSHPLWQFFTEAAEECHISQSAISQQIMALEQELGVQLLVRMNRKFELTPAGEHFYKKSLIIVADYDRLVQDCVRICRKDHAELRSITNL